MSRSRPLNARLLRHVQLDHVTQVLPLDQVECDLVVIRHPKVVLSIDPSRSPVVRAEQCVVVVNQVPTVDGEEVYELTAVSKAVENWLGIRPRFAPIGPLVRAAVEVHDPAQDLESTDWVNVIDVDEWRSDRPRSKRSPIVIGRHSRDHYIKFPNTRQSLLAAYPTTSDFVVHMLGGRKQVTHLLGSETPANWRVHEFDSIEPRRFLGDLDIYAYFHHPDLIEAFGRNMLEALAVGVPIVTHGHFSRLFDDAITVATPNDAARVIRELVDDHPRYLEQIAKGRALAESRFGYSAHIERIQNLLGRSVETRREPTGASDEHSMKRTVLFIGPNGAGLGHLTRLMALARRSRNRWTPHFLTFSTAAATVEREGFPVTYFPSRSVTGSRSTVWHAALAERLDALLDELRPAAIVVDSTEPYRGILKCLCDHPEIPVVWSRRAMWKVGVSNAVLESGEDFFDLIVEPGDLAAEFDRGATRDSDKSSSVGPITLLERQDIESREDARQFLGVDDHEVAVLVQLGAGNINDTTAEVQTVLDSLDDHPNTRVFVVRAPISASGSIDDPRIRDLRHYPLARVMRGFDMAIAATGYNTFHELMMAEVPTVFVPNRATITDDQDARARWASEHELAVIADSTAPHDLGLAIKHVSTDEVRHRIRSNLNRLSWTSGGAAAVELIAELVRGFDAETESARHERRQRAYAAVEDSIEKRAARKRSRNRTRQAKRRRPSMMGTFRVIADRAGRRGKRWALRRLGYQRLLALYTLLPDRLQRRVERTTRLTPGRADDDPTRLRIPPGVMLGDVDESCLVSILFVIEFDVDNASVADAVAHMQASMRNFKPLFLTCSLNADRFRRYGYAWEHQSRRSTRLENVLRWYRPDFVVEVDDLSRVTASDSAVQGWLRSRPIG